VTTDVTSTATHAWTRWSTTMELVVTDPRAMGVACAEVAAELDAIEAAASRFRPDSEVCALAGGDGRPTEITPLLAELVAAALTAANRTDGDVDPTVGAAIVALGYDDDIDHLRPNAPIVTTVIVPAVWTMVRLEGHTITVPAGVLLDLGATAKAIAADRCAQRVADSTGTGVMANLGGDIATAGPAPEGGWQVLVSDGDDEPQCQVAIDCGVGLATSSTVRRRWRRSDGRLNHHILDPRSGRSADPVWRTVTAVASSCIEANTLTTASVVRGYRALSWLRSLGVTARLVDRDRVVHTIGAWPLQTGAGDR
jgi:thiamine biosynthesis lipoprotein